MISDKFQFITTKTKDELVTTDNGYIGNTSNNGKDLADRNSYFEGQQDDDDFEKVVINPATGSYNIQLIKVAENDESLISKSYNEVRDYKNSMNWILVKFDASMK